MNAYLPSLLILISLPMALTETKAETSHSVGSPNEQLTMELKLDSEGVPKYSIRYDGNVVLEESRLGLIRDDEDFSKDMTLASESATEPIEDHYEILTAKRRSKTYRANRKVFHLVTKGGEKMDLVAQVSDDGVAFRYSFPGSSTEAHQIEEELTSFNFPKGTKAWLQPMSVAKSGFEKTNPAYEEYYEKEIPVGTPSPLGAGWVYPALFRTGDTWMLVSEGSLSRGDCATWLAHESPGGEYTVAFPDDRETIGGEPVNPKSKMPWNSPWRFVVVGSLKAIAESTLGIDLADAANKPIAKWIKPGHAAWSWPLLGDESANFDTQIQFIEYAAEMGWKYCLIDAWWDKQIGDERMKKLADYAAKKNVDILLWYNSAGDWNTVKMTPRDKLLTHEDRVREFARMQDLGVKGLKIDFFGGDGRAVIDYYLDILEDAEPYELLINFHGATLPRGWQRTYPHLMTMEAVKGLEYITFEQVNADNEPTHASMLPFTRNVFDPMDFTPMALDRLNDKVARRTTSGFELALSVLFTSGIQHYAEIPAGMAKAPDSVRNFLKGLPSVWEDTKFLDGYPGRFVVLARKGEGRWYLAGINGESSARPLTLDLTDLNLPADAKGALIKDGGEGNMSFNTSTVALGPGKPLAIELPPTGGFVLSVDGGTPE